MIDKIAARSAHEEMADVTERAEMIAKLLCHVAAIVTVRKMKVRRWNGEAAMM